jgi:hypothetical protein
VSVNRVNDGERRAAQRVAERAGVEHPHIGAAHARRRELGIERNILAAVRGGDEGAPAARPGEDDVARLVADEQGARDVAGRGGVVERDHADAVRQVVDHPDLAIGARGDGDRLEADRDRGRVAELMVFDAEDLEAIVGSVDSKQMLLVGRYRERTHLPALEQGER